MIACAFLRALSKLTVLRQSFFVCGLLNHGVEREPHSVALDLRSIPMGQLTIGIRAGLSQKLLPQRETFHS